MKRDGAAGIVLALLGLVALAGAPSREPVAGVMGPGVLPSLVALGLVLTGLGLVLVTAVQGRARSRAGGARGPAQAAAMPATVTGTPAGSRAAAGPCPGAPQSAAAGVRVGATAGAPAAAAAGDRAGVAARVAAGGLEAAGEGSSTVAAASPAPASPKAASPAPALPAAASPAAAVREGRVRLLVTLGALGAYTAALPVLGFPVASAVLVSGLTWYLGERRPLAALLWGVLLAVALWAGFVRGLGVPLPMGVLGR
ncbi:tripartite tricarboxylate transporter TctB family protein [Thermaerobacter subterraneus]|uniref:DUF1468 domain-containing protein n=1 Tax=Thermaerobacter subterraneus DSM 13965 TaxID=867903 RepID=K6PZM9_9FIRM|nr:tripartite tricarboxylate transporter TctB family protein [Thermaerobacter subterraneus]EKP94034.1 hypothetical protein ThesuDRAFT_01758 [Thermaerobacter subterraneus DSM 13965]